MRETDGRLDVRQTIVVADDRVPVSMLFGHSLVLEQSDLLREIIVVSRNHASLSGRDHLVAVEAEGGDVGKRAYRLAANLGTVRLRRVFDDEQSVAPRDADNRIHVRRMAPQMNGDDSTRLRRDLRFQFGGIDAPDVPVHIDEHRLTAAIRDRVRTGDESERRHKHLVIRSQSQRDEREMQCDRSVRTGDSVSGSGNPANASSNRSTYLPAEEIHVDSRQSTTYSSSFLPREGDESGICLGVLIVHWDSILVRSRSTGLPISETKSCKSRLAHRGARLGPSAQRSLRGHRTVKKLGRLFHPIPGK